MPSGVYERKPRTPAHCANISKAKLGVPNSPEHNAAISEATLGVPKPPRAPEHCDNLSKSMKNSDAVKAHTENMRGVPKPPEHIAALTGITHKNSDAVKAAYDAMRGGNDIVDHHYVYDHSDLSLNTVQMTRSDHQKLHLLLKRLGYITPHINLSDKQNKKVLQPKGL